MEDIILIMILFLLPVITALIFTGRDKNPLPRTREGALARKINQQLPQTQCRDCGYPGCTPYANAIATGEAGINLCLPGGETTIRLIAELLGTQAKPLSGAGKPEQVAVIDEDLCIGCVKCILACPVDAIIGAPKQMHTVMPKVCTGCELCLEPCPVDCITVVPTVTKIKKFIWDKPQPLIYEGKS